MLYDETLRASLGSPVGHTGFGNFTGFVGGHMKSNIKALLAAAGVAAFAFSPANAFEFAPELQKAGIFIGSSAGVPPPGIYGFSQAFTFQTNWAGPIQNSAPGIGGANGVGNKQGEQVNVAIQGFLFVPGWTFLGATYDFVVAQPFETFAIGQPLSLLGAPDMGSGVHNTYFANELAWNKIGGTGFGIKTGLGMFAPTGTVQGGTGPSIGIACLTHVGCNGGANVGFHYWTFQPELILSYLGGGWNLSAALYAEINTANRQDDYTTGDIFHADFTATYTTGKWTFGPVGYVVAQVSDDKCSSVTCLALHPFGTAGFTQRYTIAAVGGLLEYNFGAATVSIWGTQAVYAKASGTPIPAGVLSPFADDTSYIQKGSTILATLSYAIWNPPAPATPMIHK